MRIIKEKLEVNDYIWFLQQLEPMMDESDKNWSGYSDFGCRFRFELFTSKDDNNLGLSMLQGEITGDKVIGLHFYYQSEYKNRDYKILEPIELSKIKNLVLDSRESLKELLNYITSEEFKNYIRTTGVRYAIRNKGREGGGRGVYFQDISDENESVVRKTINLIKRTIRSELKNAGFNKVSLINSNLEFSYDVAKMEFEVVGISEEDKTVEYNKNLTNKISSKLNSSDYDFKIRLSKSYKEDFPYFKLRDEHGNYIDYEAFVKIDIPF